MKSLGIILLFISSAASADIFIRHPQVDEVSFIKAAGSRSQTLSNYLQASLPAESDAQRLLNKFEKAQTQFLSSDPSTAKVAFIEVTEEAMRADWTETQRRVIHLAYLRVAQLSSDPQQVQSYLQRAVHFSPELETEQKLFPPPLLRQYADILEREKAKSVLIDLAEKFPLHELILINGRRVKPQEARAVHLMPGRHRITALSDSVPPLTQELTAAQLSLMRADVPPLVIGTCEEPVLSSFQKLGVEAVSVVFPNDCVRGYTGTSWTSAESTSTSTKGALTQAYTQITTPTLSINHNSPRPILSRKRLIWIGIGAGVLATSALLIQNSKKRGEEVQPVTRQGF